MYENSGSHFSRASTWIESGLDTFDKSGLGITFLYNFWTQRIFFSFRLVLEGKTGKKIPDSLRLEFLKKIFENSFALSEHLRSIKWTRYFRFTFVENTISNSAKASKPRFLGSNRLFGFISISKFDSFKNHFPTTTKISLECLNFSLDAENLLCCYKQQK